MKGKNNCNNCKNLKPICEGDYKCEILSVSENELVIPILDWEKTDEYFKCNGDNWEMI